MMIDSLLLSCCIVEQSDLRNLKGEIAVNFRRGGEMVNPRLVSRFPKKYKHPQIIVIFTNKMIMMIMMIMNMMMMKVFEYHV